MSGQLTVWGAGQLLTSYFTATAEPVDNFYLALIMAIPPSPYMDGSELDEPLVVDYARIAIPNDALNWANDAQPQELYNILPAQFVTASSDWGLIGYWALTNAPTDGFNFIVGNLENPVLIEAGDQAVISEGDLSISLGPFFLAEEDA
jgi:hypothetical protein